MAHYKTIETSLGELSNSYNLVRLLAAWGVLISHAYIVLGYADVRPLHELTRYSIGQHAVNVFFSLSGLMLARSMWLDDNPWRFILSRCLRIFPGLMAFGLVFAFMIGPLVTSWRWADYFTDAHTYLYPFAILFTFHDATPPHGIFEKLPVPSIANAPLWTIRYELVAYFSFLLVYILGIMRTRATATFFLTASLISLTAIEVKWVPGIDTPIEHLARYGASFLVGVTAFHWRHHLSTGWYYLTPTLLCAIMLNGTPLAAPSAIICAAHFSILLGCRNFGKISAWARSTDISYGTYIYGWPIQQCLVMIFPTALPAVFSLISIVCASGCGWMSWKLVEGPTLKLKKLLVPRRDWPVESSSTKGRKTSIGRANLEHPL